MAYALVAVGKSKEVANVVPIKVLSLLEKFKGLAPNELLVGLRVFLVNSTRLASVTPMTLLGQLCPAIPLNSTLGSSKCIMTLLSSDFVESFL